MKDDSIYVDHILKSINNILEYTKDLTQTEFSSSTLIQDAVIRNFEIIGEASKRVSDEFRKVNHEVPWKDMAGMRDKLIHDYIGVDIDVIWKTVIQDLPGLKNLIEELERPVMINR